MGGAVLRGQPGRLWRPPGLGERRASRSARGAATRGLPRAARLHSRLMTKAAARCRAEGLPKGALCGRLVQPRHAGGTGAREAAAWQPACGSTSRRPPARRSRAKPGSRARSACGGGRGGLRRARGTTQHRLVRLLFRLASSHFRLRHVSVLASARCCIHACVCGGSDRLKRLFCRPGGTNCAQIDSRVCPGAQKLPAVSWQATGLAE